MSQLNLFGDYENSITFLTDSERFRLCVLAIEVNRRLSRIYVVPDFSGGRLDLLDQLLLALLSQRTRAIPAQIAFDNLRSCCKTWMYLLDQPVEKVERLIAGTTFPEQKAPRILNALSRIIEWNAGKTLSLDFLKDILDVEAALWLRELVGVGFKTSYATLLLSVERRSLLPADTHGIRVRKRLGFIGEKIEDPRRIHGLSRAVLPAHYDAPVLEWVYFLFKRHGQFCCTHSNPNCGECPLLDLCRYGRMNMGMSSI